MSRRCHVSPETDSSRIQVPSAQMGQHHGTDIDWGALGDSLELDATVMQPLVHDVLRDLGGLVDLNTVDHVLDVGCGPGVSTVALAERLPRARITALDSSSALLERLGSRIAGGPLIRRITAIETDLGHPLPEVAPADLVWASMVLHHVPDTSAILRSLHASMRPGATLAIIEFAGPPAVLPPDDPMVGSGAWARLERAVSEMIRDHLGIDVWTIDWPELLSGAGFSIQMDRTRAVYHEAPLPADLRRWVVKHVNRGLTTAGDRLAADDVKLLEEFADTAATRNDLFVRAERRVILAGRS